MTRKRALQRVIVKCIGMGREANPLKVIEGFKVLKTATSEEKSAMCSYINDHQVFGEFKKTSNEQLRLLWERAYI